VGNALKMLIVLKSKGKLKIKRLAEILEVDERTIRRYKEDLQQAGIYISSTGGKYGGYYLENDDYLLSLHISNEEYTSLLIAQKQLSDTGHPVSNDFDTFLEKINVVYKKSSDNSLYVDSYMVKSIKGNAVYIDERKKLINIHAAIISRNKVKMEYVSLKSGLSNRIINPYAIYQYNGELYCAAFCERRKKVIDFKLSRIKSYEVLNERFEPDNDFNLNHFMKNCIGIYKGKEYNVKLKINFPMSQIVKEKIWVEDQKVTELADRSILFEAKMKGYAEIKTWVLGMGSSVVVIEPEELRKDLLDEITKIKNNYEKIFS
jgi:predicted DNA-binding transcriptional regulator YafY